MEKIKVIQVGTGRFGESWLKVLLESDHVELAAVVDVVPDNLEKAGAIAQLSAERRFTSLEQAAQAVDADMVLIVTPPKTHKSLALQALELGYHVAMEKPLTHTFEEALELYQESLKYDKKVMISQNYRWRAPIQTLKRLLKEEAVGKLGYVEYDFRKAVHFGGWRNEMKEIMLEDMSIHHFDIMRYLLEKEPVEVYAQSFRPHWSWMGGNPAASAAIQFEDGIQVHYFGSWVSRGKETTWNGDIRFYGEHGCIEMSQDEIRLWKEGDESGPSAVQLDEVSAGDRMSSLHDFIAAIREDRAPLTSIADNIHSFALTCAAIQSAELGAKVKINLLHEVTR